jgi:putative transposase
LVCTTPPYSPEPNGMAEAFVKGFKRDYVYLDDRQTADEVLRKLPAWIADYNQVRPHKGMKMMSPTEYRTLNQAAEVSGFDGGNSSQLRYPLQLPKAALLI